MTARVLLLGASRYYSKSIQSVREAGFFTAVADRNPDSDGFAHCDDPYICDIVDVDGIEEICRSASIDAIVPLNDYGVATASIVSQRLGLPGVPQDAARAATIKEVMRNLWSVTGLPCPRYEVHRTSSDLVAAVRRIGFPCIVKPAHGVGGASRGVSVIRNEDDMARSLQLALGAYDDSSVIVEEFLPGDSEHSCEILLRGGRSQVVAIGDKVKSQLPYRVDKSVIYPTALSTLQVSQVETLAQKATESLGLSQGTAHLEFSMSHSGPILFEIGARCGGGATPEPIVSFVTGIHMVVEHVRSLLGETSLPLTTGVERGCVYRFLFGKEGQVREIHGWPPQLSEGVLLDAEMFVEPGEIVREVRNGTDRIGFLVVGGSNREQALLAADALEAQIKIEVW